MKTTTRFRDSWFIRAGTAIVVISALPFLLVAFAGVLTGKELSAGPTGLWFLLGAAIGFLLVCLGLVGVFFQNRAAQPSKEKPEP